MVVGDVFSVVLEVVGVAHHGAEIGHLPMHPLQHFVFLRRGVWQELAGLLPEVF